MVVITPLTMRLRIVDSLARLLATKRPAIVMIQFSLDLLIDDLNQAEI